MNRYLPPAHSPIRVRDILGAAAAERRSGREEPQHSLEALLGERFGAEVAILTGSGTQALQLALTLCAREDGRSEGPVVALPGYSCFDLASAAIGAGFGVTLYDLDPLTLAPDLESVEAALARGARVVVAAPLFGIPIPWDPLASVVGAHGALLVEDAAQAGGGRWEGRRVGSLGGLSVLSFGRGKGWTGGGGGALLARGDWADRARGARAVSTDRGGWVGGTVRAFLQWGFGRPGLYGIPARMPGLGLGETVFHPPVPPGGISAFSAGLALRTADLFEEETEGRRVRGAVWEERIQWVRGGDRGVEPIRPPTGVDPGYLRYPFLVRGGAGALGSGGRSRALGIAPGYPIPLSALPELRDRIVARPAATPGAERLASELVTLPTHRYVTDGVVEATMDLLGCIPSRG